MKKRKIKKMSDTLEYMLSEANRRYKVVPDIQRKIDEAESLVDKVVWGGVYVANSHMIMLLLNEIANTCDLPIMDRGQELQDEVTKILNIKGD